MSYPAGSIFIVIMNDIPVHRTFQDFASADARAAEMYEQSARPVTIIRITGDIVSRIKIFSHEPVAFQLVKD